MCSCSEFFFFLESERQICARQMTQLGKCVLYNHRDLILVPRTQVKMSDVVADACNSN